MTDKHTNENEDEPRRVADDENADDGAGVEEGVAVFRGGTDYDNPAVIAQRGEE